MNYSYSSPIVVTCIICLLYTICPNRVSRRVLSSRMDDKCRRKADLDFLAFCVLEETTRMTWMKMVQNDLDSHGLSYGLTQSTWPRIDHSGGCWQPVAQRYALVAVQAGEEEEDTI